MSKYPSEPFANFIDKIIDFRGRTPKKLGMDWGDGEIRALSANNVEMGKINFQKECYLGSEELYKKWMNRGDCSESDVVMTMEAPLGNIAQIPDDKKYILSQRTVLFKTKKEKILNDYFYYLLSGDEFQRELQNNATGTTAKGIQQKKLLKIDISAPKSLNKQKKISVILKSVDSCIFQTEETISKLQKIKTGLMQDLFTRGMDANGKLRPSYEEKPELYKLSPLGMIPKEWDCSPLKKVCSQITDGEHQTPERNNQGIFLLSARNILNRSLTLNDVDFIPESEFKRISKRCNPSEGDILISCSGTIGRVCVVPANFRCGLVRSVALVRFGDKISSGFAEESLLSEYLQQQILASVNQSAQGNLFLGQINSLLIKYPLEKDEQREITRIFLRNQSEIEILGLELEKFKKIKLGLMQDLLTGKVEVRVDKDE